MAETKRIFGFSEQDQRALEEEYARREKEAEVPDVRRPKPGELIPPKRGIYMPSLEELKTRGDRTRGQLGLKEKGFEDFLEEWKRENSDYELTHLPYVLDVRPVGKAEDLPIPFLDFLVNEAIKSDMVEDYRHNLFSILRNLKSIIIYNTSGMIQIGLRDQEGGLTRLFFENKPPFVFRKVE